MSKLFACLIAHNEIEILPYTIKAIRDMSIPYIAILDNPSPEVRWLTRHALDVYDTTLNPSGVYRWAEILKLMEWAIKRPRNYDWVLRIDADEVWPDIREEVAKAEELKNNIVNFQISQYGPLKDRLDAPFELSDVAVCKPGDPLFPPPNKYQRCWKLSGRWAIGGGGHVIMRSDPSIYQSKLAFKHIPAIDKDCLNKKSNRPVVEEERSAGWHIQYNKLKGKPVEPETRERKIKIFYHVAMMKGWEEIFSEQISQLIQAKLLRDKNLTIGFVSDKVTEFSNGWAEKCVYGGPVTRYEFPTLKLIWDHAQKNKQDYILYIHTKGASRPTVPFVTKWRRYMMYFMVEKWERCVADLEDHDIACCEWTDGVELTRFGTCQPKGFAGGNFWWARGDYLKYLIDPTLLDVSNRWNAEAFVGLNDNLRLKNYYDSRKHCGGARGWVTDTWDRKDYCI